MNIFLKYRNSFIVLLLINLFFIKASSQSVNDIPQSKVEINQWVKKHFSKGKIPPFSFIYGGKKSAGFIKQWKFTATELKHIDQQSQEATYSYEDPKSGLLVKCRLTYFDDFNAIEWVLNFINTSSKNSLMIEKVAVIDQSFDSKQTGDFTLYHAKGSNAEKTDFQPARARPMRKPPTPANNSATLPTGLAGSL